MSIALELFKLEKGDYLDALDALVPGHLKVLPNDPFSGKPFPYRKTEKGYVFRSFGPDLDDDVEKTRYDEMSEDENGDMIFEMD